MFSFFVVFFISALLGGKKVIGQMRGEGPFLPSAEDLSKLNFPHQRGENGAGTSEEGVGSGLGDV